MVDDGSMDQTLRVAKQFESRLVKVVAQANCGASAARNHALRLSQGDFIQWLDADDLLAPDKIELQLNKSCLLEDPMWLASSEWGRFYASYEQAIFCPDALWEDLSPCDWLLRNIDQNLWMAIESWLVSRELTNRAGLWDETMSMDDDGEYFCRVVSRGKGVKFVAGARSFVRRGVSSLSSSGLLSDKKLESQARALFRYIETLLQLERSERTESACAKLLNRWSIYFYPERMDIFEQMRWLAETFGRHVELPTLRGKYRWIGMALGFRAGKAAQFALPNLRRTIVRWPGGQGN